MSAQSRRNKSKSLKRKTARVPVKTTFRIYAEGSATEPEYLAALRQLPEFSNAVSILIEIEQTGAAPLTLVDAACRDKRNSRFDVDFYWCVFDVESPKNHPNLSAAIDKARANEVRLAISNPCFELWLVLHFQNHSSYLTTDAAVSLRKSLDGSSDKHLDAALYLYNRKAATSRAQALRLKHSNDGTEFPENNPSSTFDALVAHFEGEAQKAASAAPQRND